jgi:hypothetical protein
MRGMFHLLPCAVAALLLAACAGSSTPSYHVSHDPANTGARPQPHYPVGRQGDLTAWIASDHVLPAGRWLFAPGDPATKYPIVGIIRAASMPEGSPHDGAFLVVSGYHGPLFDLWEGVDAPGRLFTGGGGWLPVQLHQPDAVNTWVRVSRRQQIGGWSGFPVVIGDPARPEAVAGVMWYRSNTDPGMGGAASTRMLKRWLGKLRLADFAKPR